MTVWISLLRRSSLPVALRRAGLTGDFRTGESRGGEGDADGGEGDLRRSRQREQALLAEAQQRGPAGVERRLLLQRGEEGAEEARDRLRLGQPVGPDNVPAEVFACSSDNVLE